MNVQITDPFVLAKDALIIPVRELPDETRRSIECEDDDFAVSRVASRAPSTVIDEGAAKLLERFREPTTIVQATILFGRETDKPPRDIIEEVYRLVRRFVENQVLVSTEDGEAPGEMRPLFKVGAEVAGAELVRPIVLLEDTEIHLARRDSGEAVVLKCARQQDSAVAALMWNEAEALERIGGRIGPRLLSRGETEGRPYLLLEHIDGVESHRAAAELREDGPEARRELLSLITRIACMYAELHEAGLLHGDVHPSNILVDGEGRVRLIDFGLADCADPGSGRSVARGGVPFYMEPEQAQRLLDGRPPPRATPRGEQYAVGALLYELVTGVKYVEFNIERARMLEQIVEAEPLPFAQRRVEPWPDVEAALVRALSKDPGNRFASLREIADALGRAREREAGRGVRVPAPDRRLSQLRASSEEILEELRVDGPLYERGLDNAPTAALAYGAAGSAYALYRVAALTGDARRIADAQAWVARAASQIGRHEAFYNAANELSPETVGHASPLHTASGVYAVRALIAGSLGDAEGQIASTRQYLEASAEGARGLDATLGLSSVLLGVTLLLEAAQRDARVDTLALEERGNELMRALWSELDAKPRIADADVEYLGAAHGWAGFCYAALAWCRASEAPAPLTLARRLDELARLAEPTGRGAMWPWMLGGRGGYMSGWCNGSAGYVFLWTLAAELLEDAGRYTDLAIKAGWNAAEAPDPVPTLCCGLIGRSYALLNLYKHTGERRWLDRAKRVASRAARGGEYSSEYPLSLLKGHLPIALLDVELQRPMESAQPFFESETWARGR